MNPDTTNPFGFEYWTSNIKLLWFICINLKKRRF